MLVKDKLQGIVGGENGLFHLISLLHKRLGLLRYLREGVLEIGKAEVGYYAYAEEYCEDKRVSDIYYFYY